MAWHFVIDLTYDDKEKCINEFTQKFMELKQKGFPICSGGSGKNYYSITGPSIERLTDDEIIKLRELIK